MVKKYEMLEYKGESFLLPCPIYADLEELNDQFYRGEEIFVFLLAKSISEFAKQMRKEAEDADMREKATMDDTNSQKSGEQRRGKWIDEKINSYTSRTYCSECGNSAPFICVSGDHYGRNMHGKVKKTNFCPNCGAEMRKEKNE